MDWAVSLLLLTLGQVLLVALGPLSRVADPGAGTTGPGGIALLAPDSVGYLAAAATWADVLASPWPRWGYLAVLRVGGLLGDAATLVVALQAAASVLVGVLLLRTGRRLAGSAAGVVAAAFLLVNPMTAQWIRFVLTEWLFFALAAAAIALAVREGAHHAGPAPLLLAAVAAVVLRPTGPLLAGAALTLAIRMRPWTAIARSAAVAAIWLAVVAALLLGSAATGPPAEATLADQLRGGVVVEGTPDVRTTIPMPPGPGDGVLAYVVDQPVATARLGIARVAVEIAQVRRHYPPIVNIGLGAAMAVVLVLAAIGLMDRRGRVLRVPTAVIVLPLVGVVAVTFAVPEGRYGWAGLVALAPAVGVGATAALDRLRPPQSRRSGGGTTR